MLKRFIVALLLTVLPLAARAETLTGVNLSGGEFHGGALYQPPAELDWFADRGFKLFRIPVTRQRLQPVPYGALAAGDLLAIDRLYDAARRRGVTVILDEHSFGQGPAPAYYDAVRKKTMTGAAIDQVLPDGTVPFPHAILSDFWIKVAKRYPQAWLDLENEPWEPVWPLAATTWADTVQAMAHELRTAGVRNRLVVEGVGSSGVGRWFNTAPRLPPIPSLSGDAFGALNGGKGLDDPDYVFSPHMYLDFNTSGTHADCTQDDTIFHAMTEWARRKHYRYVLGEFGFGSWRGIPPSCVDRGAAVIAYMKNNPDVWIGYTIYGAGLAWGPSYTFAVDPKALDHTTPPGDADTAYLKAIR